ncbi:glutamate ligase domain-containing protein [Blattabacterium cuenoti]|uniref:glutamate ligase domain-containing protein n=1 Tax=Blattabacterium cuenoti TaxID=1653831 RepID=UPI00293BB621|nr:cyanophycin synthetase [Blattabacterium cuenoti]
MKDIKKAVEEYVPNNYRSQILIKNNKKIIIDCYNANPTSMIKALIFFNNIKGNKMVILGDMLELGSFSKKEHKKIIFFLEKSYIHMVFLIGSIFFNIDMKTSCKIKKFITKKKFIEWIKKNPIKKIDLILIKGSRKNALENLIYFL